MIYLSQLVCSRLKFHLDPGSQNAFGDTSSVVSGGTGPINLDSWKADFQEINKNLTGNMYFL